ncbi:carboxypeptidase regulatory-like domain-containing protein [Thermodesulfobacteriota bacterium]
MSAQKNKQLCVAILWAVLGIFISGSSVFAVGSISGVVVNEVTGQPIFGADVRAVTMDGVFGGSAKSGSGGTYTLQNLTEDSYRVLATTPLYSHEYYDNTAIADDATSVTVTNDVETQGINFSLKPDGSVSGTVVDEATGQPIPSVWVNVSTDIWGGISTMTDAFGEYLIGGLPAGEYKVVAYDYNYNYAVEYYDNATNRENATPVTVTSGADTPNINLSLNAAGSISGTVVDSTVVLPIENAQVCATAINGGIDQCVLTDALGQYTIVGLIADTYQVKSYKFNRDNSDYIYPPEYFNNTNDSSSATPVTVVGGVDTPSIDFSLTFGGYVSGTVVDEGTGQPIVSANVCVDPIPRNHPGCSITDTQGAYVIEGLRQGDYRVEITYAPGYILEYFDNAIGWSAATLVAVTNGVNTSNINFALQGENEDPDSDGDGVGNNSDAFPFDIAASQDFDGDGHPDRWNNGKTAADSTAGLVLDAFPGDGTEWADTDGDGVGDNTDAFATDPAASVDSDGDGYPDDWNEGKTEADSTTGLRLDVFPSDSMEWFDTDGDGIGDKADNCPAVGNAGQEDLDNDNVGNVCDDDTDGDGIVDVNDNCPLVSNNNQSDVNSNSLGDACDSISDTDGDDYTDAQEFACGSDPTDPLSKCNASLPWLMLLLDDE